MKKRSRWGDNPLRGWFRLGKKIIRILIWDNYEPLETSRGALPENIWIVLRKSKAKGVHLQSFIYDYGPEVLLAVVSGAACNPQMIEPRKLIEWRGISHDVWLPAKRPYVGNMKKKADV